MSIPEAEAEIAALAAQLRPLIARKFDLESRLRKLRSQEFIRVNGITRAGVQTSRTVGPVSLWFWTTAQFADWLRSTEPLPLPWWCEWNGLIYRTSDVMAGRLPEFLAWYDDLPPD